MAGSVRQLVLEPKEFDVVMGRGKGANNRPGNVYFRTLASSNANEYEVSRTTGRKTDLALQLIAQIEAKGGRFLRSVTAANVKGEIVGAWEVVGEEEKMAKVKQAMRDIASIQRKRERKARSPCAITHPAKRATQSLSNAIGGRLERQTHIPRSSLQRQPAAFDSELQLLFQQRRLEQLLSSHNTLPTQEAAHAGSLLEHCPSLSTLLSSDSLIASYRFAMREEQERLALRQEIARRQHHIVNMQDHQKGLFSSSPPSNMMNPFPTSFAQDLPTALSLESIVGARLAPTLGGTQPCPPFTPADLKRSQSEGDDEERKVKAAKRNHGVQAAQHAAITLEMATTLRTPHSPPVEHHQSLLSPQEQSYSSSLLSVAPCQEGCPKIDEESNSSSHGAKTTKSSSASTTSLQSTEELAGCSKGEMLL